MQVNPFQDRGNSVDFMQKTALFKRGLERDCKSKNVLKFDVEKDVGIIFLELKKMFILLKASYILIFIST